MRHKTRLTGGGGKKAASPCSHRVPASQQTRTYAIGVCRNLNALRWNTNRPLRRDGTPTAGGPGRGALPSPTPGCPWRAWSRRGGHPEKGERRRRSGKTPGPTSPPPQPLSSPPSPCPGSPCGRRCWPWAAAMRGATAGRSQLLPGRPRLQYPGKTAANGRCPLPCLRRAEGVSAEGSRHRRPSCFRQKPLKTNHRRGAHTHTHTHAPIRLIARAGRARPAKPFIRD